MSCECRPWEQNAYGAEQDWNDDPEYAVDATLGHNIPPIVVEHSPGYERVAVMTLRRGNHAEEADPEGLPRSRGIATRLILLATAGSTNSELAERLRREPAVAWPEFAVLATLNQTAGRGRLGREWKAPPGTMLAVSVVLRPARHLTVVTSRTLGWLPLLAGVAMTEALRSLDVRATLKWPNDVMIGGKKVCGVLCEYDGQQENVVVGAGVNLYFGSDDLPDDRATSLALEGVTASPDDVLCSFLTSLRARYREFMAASGDSRASGLAQRLEEMCESVGQEVRVELPGAATIEGRAVRIDGEGRIVVVEDAMEHHVAAGDIIHLRQTGST
ncbi:biotin--[acetyl-CoA-carboxylase] ligase [Planctomonas sp. JC2975]|uniref:biotin--[acetyl-CoA-carboxylase] ligase n=1 Tax=Planctomonas sp. JC2975 TaxID=2729626 RepID=UPI001475252D|nr:biotin--[acetyl-CoA-carboxylase] ligase [Planctomonas sp. JC2975]NNC13048.1 biotin--[acetyl-CoA-carboxylase] ligase [Planctomonas sp. JC2975]